MGSGVDQTNHRRSLVDSAELALRNNTITIPQMRLLMRHYEESLGKYTYLSDDDDE